jgi:hypothetical protein
MSTPEQQGKEEAQPPLTPTTEQAADIPPQKKSKLPMIMLVIVIILAMLGMVGWILWQQWQQQQSPVLQSLTQPAPHVTSALQTKLQQQASEPRKDDNEEVASKQPVAPSPAQPDAASDQSKPAVVAKETTNEAVPSAAPNPAINAPLAVVVDSQELQTAQAEITKLQAALTALQQRNDEDATTIAALRQSKQAADKALLHNQLDWIIDPDTRLPRIAALWQLIASNAANSNEQQEAADLARLATQQADTMQQWVQTLQQVLPSLQATEYPSLLPNNHWWQRWLNTQFNVHPVASKNDQERAALATTVAATIAQLQRGELPKEGQWSAMVNKLASLGFAQTSLPSSLASFITQTARLRAVARQWQEVQS